MYITDLYNEIKVWNKIRSIAKKAETELKEKGFRVDWVGRIYTVINLPEEVVSAPISQEGYVLMQLREHDKLFLDFDDFDNNGPLQMYSYNVSGIYLTLMVGNSSPAFYTKQ